MIYTVISSLRENGIYENRDCRITRQPLKLLPIEVKEYIENTKNAVLKAERELAYTILFASLNAFFDIDNPRLDRTDDGKPYLVDSDIHFNISHSDGTVAVCISDEGEVGVDIQSEIDQGRAKRLEGRFFADLDIKADDLSIDYYICHVGENEAVFENICPTLPDTESFTSKWTAAESLMKLFGRGFGDADKISELVSNARTELAEITLDKDYYLAISIGKG